MVDRLYTESSDACDFHPCLLKKHPVFRNTHIASMNALLKKFNQGMREPIKKTHPPSITREDATCLLHPFAAGELMLGVMIKT